MMEQLPEGKSIGWMQAPPQWIFSHTLRFAGIVRIVIQDGEGFILINRGKVLRYYFRHGKIELRGNAALDYFNSHPSVEFNLSRYTPEEMTEALRISGIDTEPEGRKHVVPPEVPAPEPVIIRTWTIPPASKKPEPPGAKEQENSVEEKPETSDEEWAEPMVEGSPEPVVEKSLYEPSQPLTTGELSISTDTVSLEEQDIRIASQIKNLNGIVALIVFDGEQTILQMGDTDIGQLLESARSMLGTTKTITPLVKWGPLIHMTLQLPEGNIILAPYRDNYLCLLTTHTINIGHIRRILRDLQSAEEERDLP